MFHLKLLELESELIAKEQSQRRIEKLPVECQVLLDYVEQEVGLSLAHKVNSGWRGWLSYRRGKDALIVCRGKAFADGLMFGTWKAGCDVAYGHDTITEYERHFDVSPPQDLDHLLVNFGQAEKLKVFLWYGENLAEYKLIFEAFVEDDPHKELSAAVIEACSWIMKRPKEITLFEFLKEIAAAQKRKKEI